MKKYFVPYDIALALKNIGYDEECICYYTNRYGGGTEHVTPVGQYHKATAFGTTNNFEWDGDHYFLATAPLYDQVIDWFIEKHKISIEIIPEVGDNDVYIWGYDVRSLEIPRAFPLSRTTYIGERYTALNVGILKAIELIKQKV